MLLSKVYDGSQQSGTASCGQQPAIPNHHALLGRRNGFRDPTTHPHRPFLQPSKANTFENGGVPMARGTIITRTTKSGEKRYHAALWTERPDGTRKQVWRTFELKRDAEAYLDAQSKLVRDSEYI